MISQNFDIWIEGLGFLRLNLYYAVSEGLELMCTLLSSRSAGETRRFIGLNVLNKELWNIITSISRLLRRFSGIFGPFSDLPMRPMTGRHAA